MKNSLSIIFVLLTCIGYAQPFRVHLGAGFSNYTGDLQQKRFTLEQANSVVSAGLTYTATDHITIRGTYSYAGIRADDLYSTKLMIRHRNLNFQTDIHEIVLVGEYDLLSLYKSKWSPYAFGGIGVFHFNPYTYDINKNKVFLPPLSTEGQGITGRKVYKTLQLNVPLGGGIKYALSDDIHLAFELGLRVLKTDYLDDVSATYPDKNLLLKERGQLAVDLAFRGDEVKINPNIYPRVGTKRGNSTVNDFYYFGLFRIDFRMNWFAGEFSENRKRLSCLSIL